MEYLYINNTPSENYGLVLDETSYSALITPAPSKEFIKNKSRLENGTRYTIKSPKYDERTINLELSISASSKEDFMEKFEAFCDDVLAKGSFTLRTSFFPDKLFHLVYIECSQTTYYNGSVGKFTLRVSEPDPSNRT